MPRVARLERLDGCRPGRPAPVFSQNAHLPERRGVGLEPAPQDRPARHLPGLPRPDGHVGPTRSIAAPTPTPWRPVSRSSPGGAGACSGRPPPAPSSSVPRSTSDLDEPSSPRPPGHRAGPLFGASLLVVDRALLAFTPVVPPAGAIDPTPAPSELDPRRTPDPTPAPTPDPTPAPTPDPTPDTGPRSDARADARSRPPTPDPTPRRLLIPRHRPDPSRLAGPLADPVAIAQRRARLSSALSADAPGVGRRRVNPGSIVTVTLSAPRPRRREGREPGRGRRRPAGASSRQRR